jgi:hypothetical protein
MHHLDINAHSFFLLLGLILALLATAGVPSPPRFIFFPAAFACYLIAVFFT